MLEWDDLRYFLAFARAGSMQAAAKMLGVNQSTVQRRLAELEEGLGRRLVERHLGGYRLTELGGELRPAAEAVEAAVAAFERRLAACDKDLTGTIRVTCGTILANRLQRTPLIDLFHKRNPGLRVELIICDREFDLPKEADIAIRGGEPQDDALVGRKIAEAPWAVYASRAYVERHGRPECPADIERHLVVDCIGNIRAHNGCGLWRRVRRSSAALTTTPVLSWR
jgi:DNA-binding transcriptional LysR family regulator